MKAFLQRLASVWTPHPGQAEFLASRAKVRVLACGRRWGKTDACAASILADLVDSKPSKHLILAPTLDQAKLLFDRLVALLEAWMGDGGGEIRIRQTPYPRLDFQGHTVSARSGHVGRSLRGNEATHLIVDEAAFVPEELVTEVAMPMLATRNGRLTLISTPHGKNHFWKFFQMGLEGANGVWSRTAPSSESPYVSKRFLQIQKRLLSPRAFQIEYEAQFLDAAGAVFPTEIVDAAMVPEVTQDDGFISIGVDWGRYSDYTAVAVVQGCRQSARLLEMHQLNGGSWSEMVGDVASIVARYPRGRLIGDATGLGDPVMEMLKERSGVRFIEPFAFSNASKVALVNGLRAMLETRALAFEPHPELVRQLKYFEAKVSGSGALLMNARAGFHDDLVIALALACRNLRVQYRPMVLVGEPTNAARLPVVRFRIQESTNYEH